MVTKSGHTQPTPLLPTKDDCDDCLYEIDLASCENIDSIVTAVVAIAYNRQAENELIEAIDVIRNGAGDMENSLA